MSQAHQEIAATLTTMNRVTPTPQGRIAIPQTIPTTLIEIQQLFQCALELMRDSKVKLCFDVLGRIMDTLCTQCEVLNLTNDNAVAFWREVNETWLFCLGTRHEGMSEEDWIAVRDSIIAWGDVLEWYGLVDYELGFWEEEILDGVHLRVHETKALALS